MKFKEILLIFFIVLCHGSLLAQHLSILELLKERNEIPNKFIEGKISKEKAFERISFLHEEFKKKGKSGLVLERPLFESSIYYLSNDFNQAALVVQQGIAKLKGSHDSLHFKYNSLAASIFRAMENHTIAESYFSKNFDLLSNNPSIEANLPSDVIAFYSNYSSFLAIKGQFDLLEKILFRTLSLSKTLNEVDYRGIASLRLGQMYFQENKLEDAMHFTSEAVSNFKYPYFKIPAQLTLGEILLKLKKKKQLGMTIAQIKSSIDQIITAEDKYHSSKLRLAILEAEYSGNLKVLKNGIWDFLKEAKTNKNIHLAKAYMLLGDKGDDPLANYTNSIFSSVISNRLINLRPNEVLYPDIYLMANKKLASIQDSKSALKTLTIASGVYIQIHKSIIFEEQRYALYDEFRNFLSSGLARNPSPSQAFDLIEAAKAKILNEAIFDRKNKLHNLKPQMLEEEESLLKKITKLKIENKQNEDAQKEHIKLEMELGFLRSKIEKENPRYYKVKYGQDLISADDIRKRLRSEEVLLNYFRDGLNLYVLIISKERTVLVNRRLPTDYQKIVNDFISTIYKNPGLRQFTFDKNVKIYNMVFKPVVPYLSGKKKIILIRDLELNLIPFDILSPRPSEFLIDSFTFSYDYSSTTHFDLNTNVKQSAINNQLGFAPFANKNTILKNVFREKELEPLPYSDEEISTITGTIYKNNLATKNKFYEDYSRSQIIHFATHAEVDDRDPSKSFIAFYPNNRDYKLFTEELYNLDLSKTQLVILSACETGRGKLSSGEGLLSLSRGFTYAGCPAVITTLWKAHDESSAWISTRIHEYLEEGRSKSEAVRQAKIDFRKSKLGKAFEHPYYWANFILIGDDRPVRISFWVKYKSWIYFGVSLVVIVLIYFWIKKTQVKSRKLY